MAISSAKTELFERIIRVYPTLSPKKRRVADFILNDYKQLFLMTAKELAQKCRVSEPTIIRFANDLGFSGYSEFEQYVKGLLHIELTSVERLMKASQQTDEGTILSRYCRNTIEGVEKLLSSISEKEIKKVARAVHKAQTVVVLGYRASAALAYFFGYLLRKVRPNVILDTYASAEVMDLFALSGKSLLLFAIAFPRYPRRTIEVLEYAKQFNVKIIGVSDTPTSPVIALSDEYIIIDVEGISFVDPFSHIITFLSALIHEIAFLDKTGTMERLSRIEDGVRKRSEFYSVESEADKSANPLEVSYYDDGLDYSP